MTTLTHIAVGAVIAKAALAGYKVPADPALVYAIAVLFSNIPDIDIPLFGLRRTVRLNWNHRIHSFLHFPLSWLLSVLLFRLCVPSHILQSITPYFTIATVSLGLHFLMDTVGVDRGICWLGPFVKKELSFTRLVSKPETFGLLLLTYCRSTVFKAELLLWIGSILYLIIRKPV
jgi:membrane-bound metal-dependent hydrolase YbcI (DUF457 family)